MSDHHSRGTTSVPPLPGEQSYDNALAEGRERWPNQPIPGCCGHGKEFGKVGNEHGSIETAGARLWRWWPWACSALSWLRLRFEEAAKCW